MADVELQYSSYPNWYNFFFVSDPSRDGPGKESGRIRLIIDQKRKQFRRQIVASDLEAVKIKTSCEDVDGFDRDDGNYEGRRCRCST